jgi:Myb/SANT-like DNA-binding domain
MPFVCNPPIICILQVNYNPIEAMPPKSTRARRPPNREPTSLAIPPITSSSPDQLQTELVDPRLLEHDKHAFNTTEQLELDTIEYEYQTPPQVDLRTSQLQTQSREVSWPASDYGDKATTASDTISTSKAFTWTFETEEALLNELIQQVEAGKRSDSGFKKEA